MQNHDYFKTIKVEREDSRIIVYCIQKIVDLENGVLYWEVEMEQVLEELGNRILIVDFSGVDILASAALQFLIRLLFCSKEKGFKFGLCGFQPNVLRTLKNTCLTDLLPIAKSADEIISNINKRNINEAEK
ncbi:MAG: STAS domain-containing protein [Planctomycetia bacterium]|nr:STAS domain-containing protein [Planctomycetia bacterium]